MKLVGILILLLFLSFSLFGTSFSEPKRTKIFSENQDYYLIVNPHLKEHKVFDKSGNVIWQFKSSVWHIEFVLSNDGESVCLVNWEFVKDNDLLNYPAITFYKKGTAPKTISLGNIIKRPPKTRNVGPGPIGDFWHTWRQGVSYSNGNVVIQLTNNKIISYSLKTQSLNKAPKSFPKNELKQEILPPLDTDNDGLPDHFEIKMKLNPNRKDSSDVDNDGFSNLDEIKYGSGLTDSEDHPCLLNLCRITEFSKDEIKVLNTLTNHSFVIKLGSKFTLKNRTGTQFNYKLKEINSDDARIISYSESMIMTVSKEVKLILESA